MSIHAQLSPEALENLRIQKRNSTISSIVASVLVVVVIFLVLGIFLLPNIVTETPNIVTYQAPAEAETDKPEEKVSSKVVQKPSPPANAMNKVIASKSASPTAIPVPEVDVSTPSMEFGDGQDFGGGWGDSQDFGTGGAFGGIPSSMRQRCSKEDRSRRLKESGGTEQCEKAVVKALDWLKETQNPDGSWTKDYPVAMTGLAVLTYLGHCEVPQKSKEYGDSVLKGITYLINVGLKNDGKLTTMAGKNPAVYEHGIATYALAEATTFCSKLDVDIPDLKEVTKKAGEIVMNGQTSSGSWLYNYAKAGEPAGGDNSVGFWQIQALKACKHTGIWPKSKFKEVSQKALKWLEKVQGENGAIGYRDSSARSPGLTGGGVLAFQMWGEDDSKAVKKGIEYLSKNTEFEWGPSNGNLYYHYYNVQAMINHGGKEWDAYNERFREKLLEKQNSDGSWPYKTMHHGPKNIHMTTTLATLTLQAYYRFLPGTGAD